MYYIIFMGTIFLILFKHLTFPFVYEPNQMEYIFNQTQKVRNNDTTYCCILSSEYIALKWLNGIPFGS